MATITKTYTENFESSYKATWTWTLTEPDITISSDSVEIDDCIPINTIFPSSSIKMTYAGKNRGQVELYLSVHAGNTPLVTGIAYLLKGDSQAVQSMVSGTSYAVTPWSATRLYYFNDYNSDILAIKWVDNIQTFCLKKSAIATLFDSVTSEIQLTVSLLYGYLGSDKTTTSTGTVWQNDITIRQGSITDKNIGLSLVTSRLILDAPPQITLGTPTYPVPYAGLGAYTVPLTTLEAQYGGDITSVTLTVGADSTTQAYSAATVSNQTISVTPSNVGTFRPMITVIDSRGQMTSTTLPQITVNPYNDPSVIFDVYRTNDIGIKNDEGHYALIQSTISYTDEVATLTEPSIQIDGVDLSSLIDASVTWYKTWSNTSRVSNVISDWTTLAPQNHMVTIYGLIDWDYDTTGNFAEDTSYQITLVANDSVNGHSTPITQTMSTAFYTIDFQAGGKEIAFGAPANDSLSQHPNGLFKCAMDAQFEGGVSGAAFLNMFYPVGSYYETSDTTFNPNVTWGGTWILETEGQVHISSGSNYLVNGAGTNTSDGGSPYIQAHTHAFTQPKIPNHHHSMGNIWSNGTGSSQAYQYSNSRTLMTRNTATDGGGGACTGGAVGAVSGATTGNDGNMPPYIIVNRWHRTA